MVNIWQRVHRARAATPARASHAAERTGLRTSRRHVLQHGVAAASARPNPPLTQSGPIPLNHVNHLRIGGAEHPASWPLQVRAADYMPNCTEQKLEVEPHRPVGNVEIVDSDHLLHRNAGS